MQQTQALVTYAVPLMPIDESIDKSELKTDRERRNNSSMLSQKSPSEMRKLRVDENRKDVQRHRYKLDSEQNESLYKGKDGMRD
jgi:hypothetical protein